jgi:hypothetical protein
LRALPIGFCLTEMNPGFITCDDPVQKRITSLMTMNQVVGTYVWAHALTLIRRFLRYPPGTHFIDTEGCHAPRYRQTQTQC